MIHKATEKWFALKQLKLEDKLTETEKNNAVNEIRYLASISHPNVIKYYAAFIDQETSSLNLVMEYASCGDLQARIIAMKKAGK